MRSSLLSSLTILVAAGAIVYAVLLLSADLRRVGDELTVVSREMTTMADDVRSIADDVNAIADALGAEEGDEDNQQQTPTAVAAPPRSSAPRRALVRHARSRAHDVRVGLRRAVAADRERVLAPGHRR